MASDVFRKVSLARLSSPEQLDQKLTVVPPAGWAALVSLAILILAALVWGIFGSISNKVFGNGLLIYGDGVFTQSSYTSGRITEVYVKAGEFVERGQVIARVSQDDLELQIERVKDNLAALETLNAETLEFDLVTLNYEIYSEFVQLAEQLRSARIQQGAGRGGRNQAGQISSLQRQIAVQEEQIQIYTQSALTRLEEDLIRATERRDTAKLRHEMGGLSRNEYDTYNDDVIRLEREIATLKGTAGGSQHKLVFDANLSQMQSQLENLRLQLMQEYTQYEFLTEQFEHRRQIKRQDFLNDLRIHETTLARDGEITADFSGKLSGLSIQKYGVISAGNAIGTIIPDDEDVKSTRVVLYVPLDKGKLVTEGMDVNISPATVNREEHGYMLGKVKTVSAYAVSQEHIMNTIQNQQLVQAFGSQSAVIEVEVELFRNVKTFSGYQWSSPKGAPVLIAPGTICSGEIKVATQKPIELVVPFIKRLFTGKVKEG